MENKQGFNKNKNKNKKGLQKGPSLLGSWYYVRLSFMNILI
jgi:hypothetical protein